jgi:large subunit ribosomal protein L24
MNKVKSSKSKKQRLYHHKKALHRKQQDLAGQANKKLRQQLGVRSIALRKGDTVKVVRGTKKGTRGKITAVDYKKGVIFVDKLVRKKASGEEIPLPIHASKTLVLEIDKSDAKRFKGKKIQREEKKQPEIKKEEKKEEKEKKKTQRKERQPGKKKEKKEKKKSSKKDKRA